MKVGMSPVFACLALAITLALIIGNTSKEKDINILTFSNKKLIQLYKDRKKDVVHISQLNGDDFIKEMALQGDFCRVYGHDWKFVLPEVITLRNQDEVRKCRICKKEEIKKVTVYGWE